MGGKKCSRDYYALLLISTSPTEGGSTRVSRKNEGRKEFWVVLYSLFSILGHDHALTYYTVCVMDNRKLKMDFLSLPESNGVTLFNTIDASLMGPKM